MEVRLHDKSAAWNTASEKKSVSEEEELDKEIQRKWCVSSLVMFLAYGDYISWIGMKARWLVKLKLDM